MPYKFHLHPIEDPEVAAQSNPLEEQNFPAKISKANYCLTFWMNEWLYTQMQTNPAAREHLEARVNSFSYHAEFML